MMRKRFLVMAAVLLASACQTSAQNNQGSDRLNVLVDDVAPCINPDGTCASATSGSEILDNLHDILLFYPGSNQGGVTVPDYTKFAPRLATSWEQNGLTWTFKLRQGVKSCAGNPLTADDVVYTMARAKSVSGAAPVTWFLGNVGGVLPVDPVLPTAKPADKELKGEVTKIDSSTVQFKQLNTNALFPRVMTIAYMPIFDSKEMKKHATATDPWSQKFTDSEGAAGFGPYCIKQWTPGQSLDMTVNPGSYLKPHFKEVVITKVPANANRVAAITNGQADMVTGLTPKEYQDLSAKSGVDILGWTSNEQLNLLMNYKIAPWNLPNNKLIRQAVNYAIPYDAIINNVYFGKAQREYSMGIPPSYTGAKEIKQYDLNLNKARSLLAQAGYPNGKGLEQYGNGLKVTYPVERKSTIEPVALLIQSSLTKIGIPITLDPITQAEFATRLLTNRDMPMAIDDGQHPIGTDTAYAFQLFFVTTAKGGLVNSVNYSSPALDDAWSGALKLPDSPERNAILATAQQGLMDDAPWAPLAFYRSQIAVRKGITNWVGSPDDGHSYWGFTKS